MKSSIIKTGAMLAGFLLAACLSTHAEVNGDAATDQCKPLGDGDSL